MFSCPHLLFVPYHIFEMCLLILLFLVWMYSPLCTSDSWLQAQALCHDHWAPVPSVTSYKLKENVTKVICRQYLGVSAKMPSNFSSTVYLQIRDKSFASCIFANSWQKRLFWAKGNCILSRVGWKETLNKRKLPSVWGVQCSIAQW